MVSAGRERPERADTVTGAGRWRTNVSVAVYALRTKQSSKFKNTKKFVIHRTQYFPFVLWAFRLIFNHLIRYFSLL